MKEGYDLIVVFMKIGTKEALWSFIEVEKMHCMYFVCFDCVTCGRFLSCINAKAWG